MEDWVEKYNYRRTHQGIGGFLVPAERFHGRAQEALGAMARGIDITDPDCYISSDTERSIINLSLSPEGGLTVYLLGQPIDLSGGALCRKN